MKKKIIAFLSLCTLIIAGFALGNIHSTGVVAEGTTVYVSSSGSDDNAGTSAAPYATINKALAVVLNGGTISLKDTVAVTEWSSHNKTATITGGGLDITAFAEAKEFCINDHVTITNTTITSTGVSQVYAMGNDVTIGEGVTWTTEVQLFGGASSSEVASTNLTVLSGTYSRIYGGGNGYSGTVTGDTNLYVGGTVNSTIDETSHTWAYPIFGGGYLNFIGGSTNVTFAGSAKARYVYGGNGGSYNNETIGGSCNLTVTGGSAMALYGGNQNKDMGNGATTIITGGKFEQVFGGNEFASMTGNVDLRMLGGEVTRRIYAGCYNDGTSYKVSGEISLTLGDVNVSYTSSNFDKGIYARSRYEGDVEDCQIVFATESAYNKYNGKVGAHDWGASYVMGSTTAADTYHYYTYSKSDNVITQSCAYHSSLAATATLNLGDCRYTGNEICPALECSADWEYEKPTVTYQNNIEIGKATATITIGQWSVEQEFLIIDTPTVLGGSVRLSDPSGLRFQSKVSNEVAATGATFGTLVIPKAVLGDAELTHETALVEDIKQTKWATESVKANNPEQYEEGYQYFNAVLVDIPEDYYDEGIVARSYVYENGVYYYADAIERSIMQVASYAIRDGYTERLLYDYVDKGLSGKTITISGDMVVAEEDEGQLTLDGTNCVAIWSSSDENVLTVDNNGKVKGLRAGTATVTAKMGNVTVQCIVTVKRGWTKPY